MSTNSSNQDKAVNVSSVPQLSPFRYPGGKTWLVPTVRRWLNYRQKKIVRFIEPFAGGGIVSLTVASENLADEIIMIELDDDVAAVWQTILQGEAEWLASEIRNFDLNLDSVNAALVSDDQSTKSIAFKTILKNRIFHGGILAPGSGMLKHGENGKGIYSRWYPLTLSKRILAINHIRTRIQFIHGDGLTLIGEHISDKDAVFFIDPPYTASKKRAGARLYKHFELDHELLFSIVTRIKGDFIMTYDNAVEIEDLARKYGLLTRKTRMKNTHNTEMQELIVSSNFDWWPNPTE